MLKHKNEVLFVFKHFKALVENQFSTSLKVLRTDNGIEYTNSAFQAFCSSNGILHQTPCPHSPQQNGVSKRKHRHIIETDHIFLTIIGPMLSLLLFFSLIDYPLLF